MNPSVRGAGSAWRTVCAAGEGCGGGESRGRRERPLLRTAKAMSCFCERSEFRTLWVSFFMFPVDPTTYTVYRIPDKLHIRNQAFAWSMVFVQLEPL